jgi:hypothetical protein
MPRLLAALLRRAIRQLPVVAGLCTATLLPAQNLLVNPDFDVDASSWELAMSDGTGQASWVAGTDASSCAGSGSLRVDASFAETGLAAVSSSQCVPTTPGTLLAVRASVRHDAVCAVWLGVTKYFDSECQNVFEGVGFAQAPDGDGFVRVEGAVYVESGIVAMRPEIDSYCALDGSTSIALDELYFGPPSWIFSDGFEIGETCRWSTAAP